jgi:hypothetical protein
VTDDQALGVDPLRRPLDRQAVEPESLDAECAVAGRQQIRARDRRNRPVEGRVEDRDVRHAGQRRSRGLDRGDRRCVVQRGEVDELAELVDDRVIEERRLDEAAAAVDDAVPDRSDRRCLVERSDRRRGLVGVDRAQLEAGGPCVDDEDVAAQ